MLFRLILLSLAAVSVHADVIGDVQMAVARNDFALGDSIVQKYRKEHGATPEMLEALSGLARGSLAARQLDKADVYAKETERLVALELKKRPLDVEPHLPLALGAAIEVQAQVLGQRGARNDALTFLRGKLVAYRTTSIRARIQKNINLLSLEGKAAPALEGREFLGQRPLPLAALRGKPVLLFFWAHWCGDCKWEGPILAQLEKEYAGKGLVVVAPTQRYGYAAGGQEAAPGDEVKYIEAVWRHFYPDMTNLAVPISEETFKNYGASTTPTLVLIDRNGIVRLYHPGVMSLNELRAAMNKLG